MADIFKNGKVPFPNYDSDDVTNFNKKTEFTDDVFIYGKLYANVDSDNGESVNCVQSLSFNKISLICRRALT